MGPQCRHLTKAAAGRLPKPFVPAHSAVSSSARSLVHSSTAPSSTLALAVTSSFHSKSSSRRVQHLVSRAGAESNQFDVDTGAPAPLDNPVEDLGPREDDVLPNSLADAIEQSAKATAAAIMRGNARTQVELHLTEFWDPISGPQFPNRGDQGRFWRMTRRYCEMLAQEAGCTNVRVVYPDAGVAAMLAHAWREEGVTFAISSLNDRRPVQLDDELVIVACPDPPGADDCMRLVRQVGEQDEEEGREYRPVVLFNQRLSSGDVGLGLNYRRIRENFLKNFTIAYSLRPIGEYGSVFRSYPGLWKVFLEEPEMPGRYRLIAERPSRPAGEALDFLVQQALDPNADSSDDPNAPAKSPSLLGQIAATMNSLNYFMRSLKN